jgi:opacity protein-like surface antigen
MKLSLLAIASAALLAVAASADAKVYQLDFTAGTDNGLVDFTTAGSWGSVISVSGQIDGSAILGLSGYAGADNTLYAGDPHVSYGGVSIETALDTFNFADAGGFIVTKESVNPSGGPEDLVPVNGSITAVPEPATWAMLLLGVGMIGFAARRRREGVAIVA